MTTHNRTVFALCVAVGLVCASAPALAGWSSDPLVNAPVAAKPGDQIQPKIKPFPGGGWIVSWFDNAPPGGYDVFLQRLDQAGNPLWAAGGVLIANRNVSSTQDYGLDVDGSGNSYLAFNDDRFPNEQITGRPRHGHLHAARRDVRPPPL